MTLCLMHVFDVASVIDSDGVDVVNQTLEDEALAEEDTDENEALAAEYNEED